MRFMKVLDGLEKWSGYRDELEKIGLYLGVKADSTTEFLDAFMKDLSMHVLLGLYKDLKIEDFVGSEGEYIRLQKEFKGFYKNALREVDEDFSNPKIYKLSYFLMPWWQYIIRNNNADTIHKTSITKKYSLKNNDFKKNNYFAFVESTLRNKKKQKGVHHSVSYLVFNKRTKCQPLFFLYNWLTSQGLKEARKTYLNKYPFKIGNTSLKSYAKKEFLNVVDYRLANFPVKEISRFPMLFANVAKNVDEFDLFDLSDLHWKFADVYAWKRLNYLKNKLKEEFLKLKKDEKKSLYEALIKTEPYNDLSEELGLFEKSFVSLNDLICKESFTGIFEEYYNRKNTTKRTVIKRIQEWESKRNKEKD